jgi:SpoIID/LytB domain
MEAPTVRVGILTEKAVSFVFNAEYVNAETGALVSGEQRALLIDNHIVYNGKLYKELFFDSVDPNASFDIKAVTIGVNFHWERKEDQRFRGALLLLASKEGIITINQVDVEEYLTSVISSEMSATASKELLKAHAVISRSWLLAQIEKNTLIKGSDKKYQTCYRDENELVRWYDREDHDLFDVCADDHCQRYQGITRASTPIVEEVIKETRGEILSNGDRICDARFSKCCGGVTETFEHCWEPESHPYLAVLRDSTETEYPDLSIEEEAEKVDTYLAGGFLQYNGQRDSESGAEQLRPGNGRFYRWKVTYTQSYLSDLIHRRSGMDFGQILDMIPVSRGTSGRIEKLKIVGTRKTFTIGKELEIRRTLSESHLYSSAFVVDKEEVKLDVPQRFVLTGAGWGHGVGLCQIGAAVMGAKGYDYREILTHYFPGANLNKRY